MKSIYILVVVFLLSGQLFSQKREEILSEALLLYNSEKASWNGTDIFLEKFPEKRNLVGGYISYSEYNSHKCVFFNKDSIPGVLATISFDDSFKPENSIIDTEERRLSDVENALYIIRKKSLNLINSDTLLKLMKTPI